MSKQKLVVIGNGMAGARTVEELLRRDAERFEITMFGAEPHGNYNRILLSNVLNGSQRAEEIFLNPLDWYRQNHIDLKTATRIVGIDRAAHKVLWDGGGETSYDVLLLATGSRPFVPPMAGTTLEDGARKPGIFVMRTLEDCERIAGYATKCRRAVVIGGGLLGLEAARGLMQHGARVDVVHRNERLMNQQLDEAASAMLRAKIESMGIGVHLQKNTREVLGNECVTGLEFADQSTLECDMIVVACGIAPRVELARDCGLTVERGVVVDDQMRSIDDPHIFVVGECAQHRGVTYGLVAPLWEQARVLAEHLSGRNTAAIYQGSKSSTKLKVMGVELASMGDFDERETDEVIQYSEPKRGRYKKLVIRDNRLAGAILLGDLEQAAALMQSFERGTVLPAERAALLFDIGVKSKGAAMLEMPDEATVCNCNGVSKGAIRHCAENGPVSLRDVMGATRAGTGCGSCKKLVCEIVDWVAQSRGAQG